MNKLERFNKTVLQVNICSECTRMIDKEAVFGLQCGNINSNILFIGEAPGRLGADKTKIPFSGDKTANNFEEFIRSIKLDRNDFFITNAVLCNPIDELGNNGTPETVEIKNCSTYLKQVIEIIEPKIIVTLGKIALKGLYNIKKHNISLKNNVANPRSWNGYVVFPLYHCGQKAFNHRSKELQLEDYRILSSYISSNKLLSSKI